MTEVRTRFAPSPTGLLHIGGLRTALFNFLFARKNKGKFILRIEDTDQARLVPGAMENITQTLADLNIHPDEGLYWDNGVKEIGEYGPYLQSKRIEIYKQHAQELLKKQAAYYCFCSKERLEVLRKQQEAQKLPTKYDKHCLRLSQDEIASRLSRQEPAVVRLHVPLDQKVRFHDMVYGEIEVSTNDLDDQILLKSDGFPTYHLAAVVDDNLMKISHVIRGDEWLPSTPKHVLLYAAFGWEPPKFIHLPLLLSKSRKKLSKREGDVAVKDFLEQGYLPEALLNFVALLGWNPKTAQEVFSLRELMDEFGVEKLNKAGAVFDLEKLDWLNGTYIRKLRDEDLFARLSPFFIKAGMKTENYPKVFLEAIIQLEKDRLKKLSEIGERVQYFFQEPEYDPSLLIWRKSEKEVIMQNLQKLNNFIQTLSQEKFKKEILETEIKKFIADHKLNNGEVLWPLRVALSGQAASPGPFEIMAVFGLLPQGQEIVLKRINKAVELLF